MLNEPSKTDTPMAGTGFEVWALKNRKAGSLTHGWAAGVGLGPSADDPLSRTLPSPPPALRKSSLWEALSLLAAGGISPRP